MCRGAVAAEFSGRAVQSRYHRVWPARPFLRICTIPHACIPRAQVRGATNLGIPEQTSPKRKRGKSIRPNKNLPRLRVGLVRKIRLQTGACHVSVLDRLCVRHVLATGALVGGHRDLGHVHPHRAMTGFTSTTRKRVDHCNSLACASCRYSPNRETTDAVVRKIVVIRKVGSQNSLRFQNDAELIRGTTSVT
jgi:hypothetical protein